MLSLKALEAGPLVQSSLTKDSEALVPSEMLNMLGSKEREPTWLSVTPKSPVTSIPEKTVSVSVSVPQVKRPADQRSLLVVAVLQVVKPDPKS